MPFIIMFAVPCASVGAFTLLAITRQTLNLFSLIGVVMLVGLVSKNGILLVDYANTLRTRGENKLDAILHSARIRFRPILMTTCAMIAGMTPLALGLVNGSQVRQALGIVIIGGLSQLSRPHARARAGRLHAPRSGQDRPRRGRRALSAAQVECASPRRARIRPPQVATDQIRQTCRG